MEAGACRAFSFVHFVLQQENKASLENEVTVREGVTKCLQQE